MQIYVVRVSMLKPYAVEATDEMAAALIAAEVARNDFPNLIDGGHFIDFTTSKPMVELPEGSRLTTFVCQHCEESSPKASWGEGRITCPRCEKKTLSPHAGKLPASDFSI